MSHKKPDGSRTRDLAPFQIRLLPEIKAWFEDQARINHRSLSSEIAYRLEQIKNQQHEQTA